MSWAETRVLVLSFTDHGRDPRVHRQIEALRHSCDLTTAGLGPAPGMESRHVTLLKRSVSLPAKFRRAAELKLGLVERYYWGTPIARQALQQLEGRTFDVIVANDMETLLLALALAGDTSRVYLDAHEYEPRHMDDRWMFRFFLAPYWDEICRRNLPKVHYMTTVCQSLADEYMKHYDVECDVLTSAPHYEDLQPSVTKPGSIRLIHHGGSNRSRRLEMTVEMMDHLDERFSLDMMLLSNDRKGMERVEAAARERNNVRIIDPVPMPEIARFIQQYDVAVSMIWPKSFNYRYSLPNKLFEAIQGRLALAVWPSPEMKCFVETCENGVVAKDFTSRSMAETISELNAERIQQFKAASARAAETHNAEVNSDKLTVY